VDRIGDLLASGELTDIVAVPTSIATYEQALGRGIPLATLDEQPKLDVAIDGADEVSLRSRAQLISTQTISVSRPALRVARLNFLPRVHNPNLSHRAAVTDGQ
jgi:hypothetical protein